MLRSFGEVVAIVIILPSFDFLHLEYRNTVNLLNGTVSVQNICTAICPFSLVNVNSGDQAAYVSSGERQQTANRVCEL